MSGSSPPMLSRLTRIVLVAFCLPHLLGAQDHPPLTISPRIEPAHTFEVRDAQAPPKRPFLRLVSYNIEWFPAGQRPNSKEHVQRQIDAVAAILRKIDPDIVATQETRNLGALVALNNRMDRFFRFLASSHYREENTARVDEGIVQQETGLLSRLPWLFCEEIDFGAMPRGAPTRGWLVASFDIRGLAFTLYNGHTKSNFGASDAGDRQRNYQNRLAAMLELRRDWARRGIDPRTHRIIVLGDMNTDLFSNEFKDDHSLRALMAWGFRHTWEGVPPDQRITFPPREGESFQGSTLDYIFLSEAWGPDIPRARTLPEGTSGRRGVFGGDQPGIASDHYPVILDLPFPPAP
ncbi:MAG: endonuclease/exonuclease/phosphatase family protein [Verrucomicrobiia bacterium]